MDKKKEIIWSVVSLLLAGLTVWAVFKQSQGISLQDIVECFKNGNKAWILCAVVCVAAYIVLEGIAILSILKGIGYRRSVWQGLLYSTSDIYFSAITPSATGGQPASAWFMISDKIPAGVTTAVLILNLMMYTLSIVVLGIIAVIINYRMFFEFRLFSKILIGIGFVLLSLLAFVYLSILRRGEKVFNAVKRFINFLGSKHIIKRTESKLKKVDKAKEDFDECSKLFAGKTDVLFKAFIWNFLQRASQIAVPMFIFLALGGAKEHAASVFASQCLITIGFNWVPIPGAMGVSDFLMVDGFLELMGRTGAFQVDMLSRGLSFYICVLLSGIITLIGYIHLRRKNKA